MEDRLVQAAAADDLTTVRRIMRKPGAVDIDYKDGQGNSALANAAAGTFSPTALFPAPPLFLHSVFESERNTFSFCFSS